MSYGKLNIWIRYADCSLVTDCWRTDLVIKTCGGEALVDMDPTVLESLKAKYEDFEKVDVHNYAGEKRILLKPVRGQKVYHIEIDVPPGCYIVWTRVCYKKNEETNKVMVIVGCGGEVCVNLLLDALETCGREIFHPLLERLIELKLPKQDLQFVAKVLMDAAEIPKKDVIEDLGQRLEEVDDIKDQVLQKAIVSIRDIVKAIPSKHEKK